MIRGLLRNDRTTFAGKYYQLDNAPLEPKPVQRPLPLLIGGGGEKVTLRIAARYADEWNTWGTPETLSRKIGILERHCADVGRDPSAIRRSAQALFFLDEPEEAVEAARAARRFPVIAGDVAQMRQTVEAYAVAGIEELIIPDRGLGRGEHRLERMDCFIQEIAPAFS